METMRGLKAIDIVERAEARHDAWTAWAVFWLAIGAMVGASAAWGGF